MKTVNITPLIIFLLFTLVISINSCNMTATVLASKNDTSNVTTHYNVAEGAPAPMPVISRNAPAFSSTGSASLANDEDYSTFWQGFNGEFPYWLTYDLSSVNQEQRSRVVLIWRNDTWTYDSGDGSRFPSAYTIDVHAAPGDGQPPEVDDPEWLTVINVDTDNLRKTRDHVFDMTNGNTVYNWVRLYVTECANDNTAIRINMDIHDAHLGLDDSWFFGGDSITCEAMRPQVTGDLNFAQIIHEALDDYFPLHINAGISGLTSYDGARLIPEWIQDFSGTFVTLNFGTNDVGYGTSDADFLANFETMVNAVISAGKIPVIPSIPWNPGGRDESIEHLNSLIDQIKADYPEVLDGPDLYNFLKDNPENYSPDDWIHPNDEGMLRYRRLWAETMLEVVYGYSTN